MKTKKITLDVFKCRRCGHEWTSKTFTAKNPPNTCAKCKSPFWSALSMREIAGFPPRKRPGFVPRPNKKKRKNKK
jgi:DNA replicative helicase MCM subunit Mcm2 (Cdc46/Mcm family)